MCQTGAVRAASSFWRRASALTSRCATCLTPCLHAYAHYAQMSVCGLAALRLRLHRHCHYAVEWRGRGERFGGQRTRALMEPLSARYKA